MMRNDGRTKIVDNEIVYEICLSSTRLGSGISYLISEKDVAKHWGERLGIVAIFIRVFDEFLEKHADIQKYVSM